MRVFCLHPQNDYNIGDLLTFYGGKYLVKQAFPDAEFLQFDIHRAFNQRDTYISEYNWGNDIDMILLPGSPWISTQLTANKNSILMLLDKTLDRWKYAYKIAIGIGSYIPIAKLNDEDQYMNDIYVDLLREFDFICVRDTVADTILSHYNIPHIFDYDTAIYSYYKFKNEGVLPSKPILIYYDPFVSDVKSHMHADIWQTVIDYQLAWAEENDAEIFAVTSGDKSSLSHKGVPCRFVTDIEWLASKLKTSPKFLSCRIHGAIFALIMGCPDVSLIPVDSRAYTAYNIGIKPVYPHSSLVLPTIDSAFDLGILKSGGYGHNIISGIREVFA